MESGGSARAGVPRVAIPTPADIANVVTRNLVPVAGVLLFGWSALLLVVVYAGVSIATELDPARFLAAMGEKGRKRAAQPRAPRASTGHSASTFPPRTVTIQS